MSEYKHVWGKDGERCIKCGDKDWMGGTCSVPDTHVLPVGDFKEHVESENCWCRPSRDGEVIVHNSMDGRELIERGERLVQ